MIDESWQPLSILGKESFFEDNDDLIETLEQADLFVAKHLSWRPLLDIIYGAIALENAQIIAAGSSWR